MKIALATGLEELNEAIKQSSQKEYEFESVHYREYFKEVRNDFNICIISKLLPGEQEFDKLIYSLKSKNTRVIMILLDQDKEELETCIKYQIIDVLTQPIKPATILDTIETPKTFKDIEFIYKKLGLEYDIGTKEIRTQKKKRIFPEIFKSKKRITEDKEIESKTEHKKEETQDRKQDITDKNQEETTEGKEKYIREPDTKEDIAETCQKLNPTETKKDRQTDKSQKEQKIIETEYILVKAKSIGMMNLTQGAGSTFITMNLAHAMKEISMKTTIIEMPGQTPDVYNIITEVEDEDYESVIRQIDTDEQISKPYIKNGIKYYINDGYEIQNWNKDKTIRYTNTASNKSDIDIYDLSNMSKENYKDVISKIDKLYVVVDPLPYKLMSANKKLNEIREIENEYGINVQYIINKMTDIINKKDIEDFLNKKKCLYISFIKPEIISEAMYRSKTVYENAEGKQQLQNSMMELIRDITPIPNKKKKGIFRR